MDTGLTPPMGTRTDTADDPFRAVESELGLIERRADPDDSRGQLIRLTELGARRSQDVRAAGRAFLRRALRSWSDEDAALLASQLARLNLDLCAPPEMD